MLCSFAVCFVKNASLTRSGHNLILILSTPVSILHVIIDQAYFYPIVQVSVMLNVFVFQQVLFIKQIRSV